MSQVSNYLDMLTHEIGPRPAASDTERQTAEWLQDQFNEAGVAAELHDFDAPRTPESARIFTYLIAPIATFGIGASFLEQMWVIHWACWLALAALSVLTLLDLYGSKGPKGLVALLPKNPSQNVVAKSVPSTYAPGEMPKRVVLVANYDSALTSPLMSESTISIHRLLQTLANGVVLALPLLTLSLILNIRLLLPITTQIFYVLLVLCVPGVILLINRLIARVMNRYSPGANNNASGIAAMLFAMNKFNESQQGQSSHAAATAAVKLAAAEAKAAKAAMQSSKMPGIDYRPPQTSASSSSLESTADDLSSDEAPPATESLKNAEADVGAEDTSIPAPTADSNATNVSAPVSRERFAEFETVEFSKLGSESMVEVSSSYAALDDYDAETTFSDEPAPARGNEVLNASVIGAPAPVKSVGVRAEPSAIDSPRSADRSKSSNKENRKPKSSRAKGSTRPKKSLFSFGKNRHDSHDDDPSNWLGLDDDFNARKEGKAIGSWDNFGEGAGMLEEGVVDLTDSFAPMGGQANTEQQDSVSQADSFPETDDDFLSDEIASLSDSFAPLAGPGEGEDDDGFAWKGGFAGDDPIEDDAYASAEAARIRRKVLDSLDVELKEKEVWFVATGAHYAERAGIRAFMEDYGDQLRGALFINISAVGSGDLYWSTKEKFGKARPSSARLTSMLRRLSRESQVRIKPWKKQALVSDAGPILAAGRKAITLTRLTEKGIPFAFASAQDTAARLDSSNIEEAADIVCSIIREA